MSNNTQSTTNPQGIQLSDNASKRIAFLLSQEENKNAKLRVSVEGGGCSGFQYKFEFVTGQEEEDILLEKDGAKVLIDDMSAELMQGAIIEFVDSLGASHFEIQNPQASASCGCGNSFAV